MRISRRCAILTLALLPGAAVAQADPACPAPGRIIGALVGPMATVRYLADDALQGRRSGSPGAHCASDYIAARFQALGLEPGAPDGSWFQAFPLRTGARLTGVNQLEADSVSTPAGAGWIPFGFSPVADVEAPSVYLPAAAEAPHEGIFVTGDIAGKIVVVQRPTGDVDEHFLASAAGMRGARAVIVLFPEGRALPDPAQETRPSTPVPAAAVAAAAAGPIREAARAGRTIHLVTSVEPIDVQARNVVARLPARDSLAGEAVVLGAHFDHLGLGGPGSLAPDQEGQVHNGADDNASGVAAILDVARQLRAGPPLRRTVYFIAFSGEEEGLLGSGYFVAHPSIPVDSIVAMLNFDMVGRLRAEQLSVFGVGTADEWRDLVRTADHRMADSLVIAMSDDGFGPSDHSSFYGSGIPVLHFFTNVHEDYHRPSDDWQKVNGPGITQVAELAAGIAETLTDGPRLTPRAGAGDPHAGRVSGDPNDRGYGPYLGTIPDFTPVEHGVRLTGVRKGSPAEKAGLRGGDVILRFGDRDIGDLYAYTYALRAHKAGDTVQIEVVRDGKLVVLTAVLGQR